MSSNLFLDDSFRSLFGEFVNYFTQVWFCFLDQIDSFVFCVWFPKYVKIKFQVHQLGQKHKYMAQKKVFLIWKLNNKFLLSMVLTLFPKYKYFGKDKFWKQ